MSEPTARTGELHPAKRQSINAELEAWRANKMEPNFAIQCMFAEALWERWNAAIPTEAAQHSEGPATIGEHDDCASVYVLKSKHLSRRTRFDCHSKADAIWLRDALNERAALQERVKELEGK